MARGKGKNNIKIVLFNFIFFSLLATLKKHVPNLLPHELDVNPAAAIPEEIPEQLFEMYKKMHVEDIGEPTSACFFSHSTTNPTGWYICLHYCS